MSTDDRRLTYKEISRALDDFSQARPILNPARLAQILGLHLKTIYAWIAAGRLDGAYRKRGKYNLIWRDRVLELLCCTSASSDEGQEANPSRRICVTTFDRPLTLAEIRRACEGWATFLTAQALAQLLDLKSVKTVYGWIANGRLKGAARKRGKHILIARDRALDILFNGAEWIKNEKRQKNPSGGCSDDLPPRKETDLDGGLLARRNAPPPIAQNAQFPNCPQKSDSP